MTAASRQTAPVLEKMYQFVLWLIPTVEKFPRSQKFLLGERLQANALDVLEGLVDAAYTRNRADIPTKRHVQGGGRVLLLWICAPW